MSRPKLLDAFCGAGGCSVGYHRAGFDVTGVDINPQKNYPYEFHQGDALEFIREHGHEFDVIHASPPCQAHTALRTMHNARTHADLVPETRALLQRTGLPYVIENVPGARIENGVILCGTMFGLGFEDAELRRHRLFESNVMLLSPTCRHGGRGQVVGVYGGHLRNRKRTIGVYGEGCLDSLRKIDRGVPDFDVIEGRRAMGIDWMTLAELCQAIPPAYTEYLGRQIRLYLDRREAA